MKKLRLKITLCVAVLLCAFVLHAADAQSLTFSMQNTTIENVMDRIEQESDYTFLVLDRTIALNKSIASIELNDASIDQAVSKMLAGTGISHSIMDRQILLTNARQTARSQPQPQQNPQDAGRQVSGTVRDASGEAIVGAMVTVQGTSTTAITDNNGAFSLRVPENGVLSVSFYGYASQDVSVGNQTSVNVTLQTDAQLVEDVVVVGYGVQKKETLTGAVSAINADDIVTTKTNNVISNLQGKMAGLLIRQQGGQPGVFDNAISIRGFGTPLIIIDGVVRGGRDAADATAELAQLNSDDIESVSILKDGAAAIYGMNASNGAIIVTTKKGSEGKTRFSYSGMVSVKRPTGLEMTMSGPDFMRMENEMYRNDGAAQLPWTEAQIENAPDSDWTALTLKKRVTSHSHNLSVSGGSDKVQYFVSGSYSGDPGLLTTDVMYYKRYTFRSSVTAQLTKDLKMNVGFSGYKSERQDSGDDFWSLFKTIFASERYVGIYAKDTDPADQRWSYTAPEGQNPLARITPEVHGYRRWETLNGVGQIDLTYTAPFLEGLSFKAMADYNFRLNNWSQLSRNIPLYNYESNVQQSSTGTDAYENRMDLYTKGYFQLNANYQKSFGNHNISALVAGEGSMTRADRLSGRRQYSDVYTHDILDQATASTATNGGNRRYGRLAAYLAKVNYDYAGKYLIELTGRYDGSYRYAPEKRWAFFPAGSIGWRISEESFIKDNLPWMSNLKLRASYGEMGRDQGDDFQYIPGYSGNTGRGSILSSNVLTIGHFPPGIVNSDMSWVTTSLFDVGLDFDLRGGVFGFSFDFFRRKNSGVLGTRQETVPNFFGATFPEANINSDMNIGLELEVRHRGNIGNDFHYSVSANTTYARQKVLHNERAPWTTSWDRWRNMNSVENRLIGRSLIHNYDGQFTNRKEFQTEVLYGGTMGNSKMLPGEFRLRDTNGDGRISDDDKVFDGWTYGDEGWTSGGRGGARVNPPLQYGLSFMGEWKGISLSFLFQGAALYSVNFRSQDIYGYGRYRGLHEKYFDRWHPTEGLSADPYDPATQWTPGKFAPMRTWSNGGGEDNSRPGTQSDAVTKLWRPRADYLRLKNLEIGYELPQSVIKPLRIQRLRVFVNATNLLTFTNKELKKLDPEKQETDYSANMTYPIMKDINFGVNLNF